MTDRKFKGQRGFLTFAQNSDVDYLRLAYGLALSLRASQSQVTSLSVCVTPGTIIPDHYREVFDEIIEIPWGDAAKDSSWKLENEWKAYHITPYRETIKLDCDMLFLQDIDSWWDMLKTKDVWATTNTLTFRGEKVISDFYRKTFTKNELPNVYSAFMYFQYSDLAKDLFEMMEIIFTNWEKFRYDFLEEPRPDVVSTDLVLAMAMKLMGVDEDCTDDRSFPTFIHMKSKLQNWDDSQISEEWTKHMGVYFTDDLELKIGRYRQLAPLHYHIKDFLTDEMIEFYENAWSSNE